MRRDRLLLLAIACVATVSPLYGEPKPEDRPKIVVAAPMGVVAGSTAKVTLRGKKLDGVTEVRCQPSSVKAKLLGKGTIGDIPQVGNSRSEIELTIPAGFSDPQVTVTVVNSAGESNSQRILIDRSPILAEKEPNNGFAQAQVIAIGQTIEGVIEKGFDVDVYRFEGKAGQRITAEVLAARYGSPLDSFLTLYTGDGQIVAANDDLDSTTTDSRLEATLPRDGSYYLVLVDANDRGSPAHVYRLSLQAGR
jgi:hypothetical protein